MSWGIAALALVFRGLYLGWAHRELWFHIPIHDSRVYDQWAKALLAGGGGDGGLFLLNPGYAYVLAGLYAMFGGGPWAPALIQCGLGIVTAVLVAQIGRAVAGSAAGWVAGVLYALAAPLPFYEAQRLSVAWLTLANTLALWWLIVRRQVFLSGLGFGVSALFRPNVLLASAALSVGLWRWRGRRVATGFLLGLVTAIAPLSIRNLLASGEVVLTTVAGGVVLYLGNSPGPGLYAIPAFVGNDPQTQAEEYRREASRRAGRSLTPSEASRFWAAETLRAIVQDLRGWLARMARKALALIHAQEVPINFDYELATRGAPLRSSPVTVPVLWMLGGLGLWCGRRSEAGRFLGVYVLCYAVALMGFLAVGEHRPPIFPALAALGGVAFPELRLWWRSTRSAPRWTVLTGIAALMVVLHRPVFFIDRVHHHLVLAHIALASGRPARALTELDNAERLGASPDVLLEKRAIIHASAGQAGLAAEAWARALDRQPHRAPLWRQWESFMTLGGAHDRVVPVLRSLVRENSTAARVLLGDALMRGGQAVEARRLYREASLDPRFSAEAGRRLTPGGTHVPR